MRRGGLGHGVGFRLDALQQLESALQEGLRRSLRRRLGRRGHRRTPADGASEAVTACAPCCPPGVGPRRPPPPTPRRRTGRAGPCAGVGLDAHERGLGLADGGPEAARAVEDGLEDAVAAAEVWEQGARRQSTSQLPRPSPARESAPRLTTVAAHCHLDHYHQHHHPRRWKRKKKKEEEEEVGRRRAASDRRGEGGGVGVRVALGVGQEAAAAVGGAEAAKRPWGCPQRGSFSHGSSTPYRVSAHAGAPPVPRPFPRAAPVAPASAASAAAAAGHGWEEEAVEEEPEGAVRELLLRIP